MLQNKHTLPAAAAAKSLQSCPTLCHPIDGSPPGSPIPGILQPRTLEWVAISFSNAGKRKVKVKSLSCVRPSATPWTAAFQAPPSMGFSRQEYWSGVPSPSPRCPHEAGSKAVASHPSFCQAEMQQPSLISVEMPWQLHQAVSPAAWHHWAQRPCRTQQAAQHPRIWDQATSIWGHTAFLGDPLPSAQPG